jgi:uncharacterized RDD family membrane protein YckC
MQNAQLGTSNMRWALTLILVLEGLPLHLLLARVHPGLAWAVTVLNGSSFAWLWWPRRRADAAF